MKKFKEIFDSTCATLGLKFKPTEGEELVISIVNKVLAHPDTVILVNADVCYLVIKNIVMADSNVAEEKYILISATNAKVIGQHNIITKRLTNEAAIHIRETILAERNKRIKDIAQIMDEKENKFLSELNDLI